MNLSPPNFFVERMAGPAGLLQFEGCGGASHSLTFALGGPTRHQSMTNQPIISQDEALRILKNDLRKLALEKHAAELNNATPERRSEILAQIEGDIEEELRKRPVTFYRDILLY